MKPRLAWQSRYLAASVLLLSQAYRVFAATTISRPPTETLTSVETCESRSINYVTAFPNFESVCARQKWTDTHATATSDPANASSPSFVVGETLSNTLDNSGPLSATITTDIGHITQTPTSSAPELDSSQDSEDAFSDASFLSFEEWKKQIAEKSPTDPEIASILREGEKKRKGEGGHDTLENAGDDGEIDIDFKAFIGETPGTTNSAQAQEDRKSTRKAGQDETGGEIRPDKPKYRGKDAGKTCKERTNFASADTGAQVMKANLEAKSSSALLSENRDAYMLNTCQAKNKFLIVELSDSILVETVAMANFEFFSSTFRQFRISVSDRYPVKLDRWVDLGTFEARNSREIQAFLVEDPRVWARYLRIEFLSHYGNEFYCPVSLLRVHGRTMIQDVLNGEEISAGEDDDAEDNEDTLIAAEGEKLIPEAVADILKDRDDPSRISPVAQTSENISAMTSGSSSDGKKYSSLQHVLGAKPDENLTTPWDKSEKVLQIIYGQSARNNMCFPSEIPVSDISDIQSLYDVNTTTSGPMSENITATNSPAKSRASALTTEKPRQEMTKSSSADTTSTSVISTNDSNASSTIINTAGNSSTASSISSIPHIVANTTAVSSNKSSVTSVAHASQPTTQESFFKIVSKRLQLLEQNSTLSLKYIEEQSRNLREAFNKVEKRQLSKTTSFLENLNSTVLEELRRFSKQYDQIWQSTVIELETQRDQSRREVAAISTRLNVLADELVFQKRMSIVQSVLLLLCLGLVVFSKFLAGGHIDVSPIASITTKGDLTELDARDSPRPNYSPPYRPWRGGSHRKQRSGDSYTSLTPTWEDSPQTPFSNYSEQAGDFQSYDAGDEAFENEAIPESPLIHKLQDSEDSPTGQTIQGNASRRSPPSRKASGLKDVKQFHSYGTPDYLKNET
jgi:hypothetical protein